MPPKKKVSFHCTMWPWAVEESVVSAKRRSHAAAVQPAGDLPQPTCVGPKLASIQLYL